MSEVNMSDGRVTPASLKRHAVGVPGIVFFVVAAAAPLAATLGGSPLAFMAVGKGAPGTYALTGVVLLLFAVGYGAMSRHVTSAAGFAAYLEAGLGRVMGFVGAAVALLSYNCMLIGLYGFFGFITSSVVADLTGAHTDWKLWTFLAWGAVAILAHREINLSAKVLGVLMVGEVLILLLFDAAVLIQGGAAGVNVEAFHPGNVLTHGLGVAILFAAASFVGFEATAIYGEEAKDPARTVPRATYVAIVLIAVFYTLATWAIGLAYGGDNVRQAALDNPPGFVFDVNDRFVGVWSTHVMNVLVVTSMFAVLLAFHNTLARYMFALGRSQVLPGRLGLTHRQWQSPHWASGAGSVVTAVVVGAFALAGADPFAQMYAWLVGVGTVGVVSMQAATCISVIAFFVRKRRDEFRLWSCGIAPLLGAAGLIAIVYLAWTNWTLLTGATTGIPTRLPWLVVAATVVGIAWARFTRASGASIAGALGHPDQDEAPEAISALRTPILD